MLKSNLLLVICWLFCGTPVCAHDIRLNWQDQNWQDEAPDVIAHSLGKDAGEAIDCGSDGRLLSSRDVSRLNKISETLYSRYASTHKPVEMDLYEIEDRYEIEARCKIPPSVRDARRKFHQELNMWENRLNLVKAN